MSFFFGFFVQPRTHTNNTSNQTTTKQHSTKDVFYRIDCTPHSHTEREKTEGSHHHFDQQPLPSPCWLHKHIHTYSHTHQPTISSRNPQPCVTALLCPKHCSLTSPLSVCLITLSMHCRHSSMQNLQHPGPPVLASPVLFLYTKAQPSSSSAFFLFSKVLLISPFTYPLL